MSPRRKPSARRGPAASHECLQQYEQTEKEQEGVSVGHGCLSNPTKNKKMN